MPLSTHDRHFLRAVERLKVYSVCIALGIFVYLLLLPPSEIRLTTSVLAVTFSGVFLLAQRLLSLVARLDLELTRAMNALRRSLPEDVSKKDR